MPAVPLTEQLADQLGLGDEEGRAGQRLDGAVHVDLAGGELREHVLDHENADHAVEALIVDGEAGVMGAAVNVIEAGQRGLAVDADGLCAGRHDLVDVAIAEVEDAVEQLGFVLLHGAGLSADVDQHAQLGLGDRGPGFEANA
jgi:hypothetical protein